MTCNVQIILGNILLINVDGLFFSSWSKRIGLGKKCEEDELKLLEICSASEAYKELIRHEVRAVIWALQRYYIIHLS